MPGWGLCILSADSGESVKSLIMIWGGLSGRLVWCWCVVGVDKGMAQSTLQQVLDGFSGDRGHK